MDNQDVANIFNEIADILELKNENQFRVLTYRKAARTIENLPQTVSSAGKIPGVGEDLTQKIDEILKTKHLKFLDKMRKSIPSGLIEMLNIPGMGPKTISKLNQKFGIKTIADLEKILASHKIAKLKGFGAQSEENICEGIKQYKRHISRFPLGIIYPKAQEIVNTLKKVSGVKKVDLAGSIRRKKETIGDIDILCTSLNPLAIIEKFCSLEDVKKIKEKGKTKAVVILRSGVEADLRVLSPESYGAALHYFTGNKDHNIKIRSIGAKKGLKINEYGVFRKLKSKNEKGKTETRVGGKTEKEIFNAVNLPYIEPELREDRGEIEAAFEHKLPHLIQLSDIKGDLHIHTNYSEGINTIEEMAREAIKMGYEYILISDHTTTVGITHGMDEKKILRQMKEIDKINKAFRGQRLGFRVLKGVECDIRADSSLDLPDKILAQLDIVIGAIHSKFKMDQTARLIKACQNKNIDIIAHPTGRLLGKRDPYEVDLDKVMDECKKTNTCLELNAHWSRLDLSDINCLKAKQKGIKIAISTDAHSVTQLNMMKFGISTARRGWLEKKDVINTSSTLDF